jgi:hypothetical protein
VVVVFLVRRQMNEVNEEVEEDRVVMIDKEGKTDIKIIDNLLNSQPQLNVAHGKIKIMNPFLSWR